MTKTRQSVAKAMIFLVLITANIWVWWDVFMECGAWVHRLLGILALQW